MRLVLNVLSTTKDSVLLVGREKITNIRRSVNIMNLFVAIVISLELALITVALLSIAATLRVALRSGYDEQAGVEYTDIPDVVEVQPQESIEKMIRGEWKKKTSFDDSDESGVEILEDYVDPTEAARKKYGV